MNAHFNMVLSDELLEAITSIAEQEGKTKSGLIRELIEARVDSVLYNRIETLERKVEEHEKQIAFLQALVSKK